MHWSTRWPRRTLANLDRDGRHPVGQIDTVMSCCQQTLQDRRLATHVSAFDATGTAVINASRLAMGTLTERGAPPWHPAPPEVGARCARAAGACRSRCRSGNGGRRGSAAWLTADTALVPGCQAAVRFPLAGPAGGEPKTGSRGRA